MKLDKCTFVSIDVLTNTDHIRVDHDFGDTKISIEMKKHIKIALNKLHDRQNEVISRMFGFEFDGEIMKPMLQAKVADVLGISRQRICAIVNCAMTHLKKELEKYNET